MRESARGERESRKEREGCGCRRILPTLYTLSYVLPRFLTAITTANAADTLYCQISVPGVFSFSPSLSHPSALLRRESPPLHFERTRARLHSFPSFWICTAVHRVFCFFFFFGFFIHKKRCKTVCRAPSIYLPITHAAAAAPESPPPPSHSPGRGVGGRGE